MVWTRLARSSYITMPPVLVPTAILRLAVQHLRSLHASLHLDTLAGPRVYRPPALTDTELRQT